MEPKMNSPEYAPQPQGEGEVDQSIERVELPQHSPEKAPERQGEQHHATTSATPVPISLPTPVLNDDSSDDSIQSTNDPNPLTAADDDLIEKEWVDKAKKIVEETRDDPHRREQEVGKLQADYLRKRYGKELGSA
ncbi:MAG TPA: hypothetical protein PLU21_01455 [Candidatus Saccharibacteria bacterium]|nr:hypothetical protein [Candidatus Saccharibacteria bacterium]